MTPTVAMPDDLGAGGPDHGKEPPRWSVRPSAQTYTIIPSFEVLIS